LVEPLGYSDFLALMTGARLVITDSGGVQEETTYLGVHCLTLRPNTERPVTMTMGTNRLVKPGEDIAAAALSALRSTTQARRPPLWDGCASRRIADALLEMS
jgi:UDP-N-acetylglucosamine 2-epimerase (non-hydrolysing)